MAFPSFAAPPRPDSPAHASTARPLSIRYLGFRTTGAGREYRLRVDGDGDPRVFVLLIPHAAFAERQARFQDAPDLCYAKLQRELAANASLAEDKPLVLTAADLAEYREQQAKRSPQRRRRPPSPAE
jgi:hypothetical protein